MCCWHAQAGHAPHANVRKASSFKLERLLTEPKAALVLCPDAHMQVEYLGTRLRAALLALRKIKIADSLTLTPCLVRESELVPVIKQFPPNLWLLNNRQSWSD